jgi:hypothetical protein
MNARFAARVAGAAVAILLLGACSDTGRTTLAKGEGVGFVGGAPGLSDQTMDITAEEDDGEVTGEARFSPAGLTVALECADTDTDGLVIVGGAATADSSDGTPAGEWVAVVIHEGDPDRALVHFEGEDDYGSCRELLEAIPEDIRNGDSSALADVTGGDIETG